MESRKVPASSGNGAQGGFIAAEELIRRHPKKFTAISTGNDQMALGVIRALSLHGLSVLNDDRSYYEQNKGKNSFPSWNIWRSIPGAFSPER
jgi:Periplasmic binding proteins and sugar binding domain of LacI family